MSCSLSTLLAADPQKSETPSSPSSSPVRGQGSFARDHRSEFEFEVSNLRATPRLAYHLLMDPSISGHDTAANHHHHHDYQQQQQQQQQQQHQHQHQHQHQQQQQQSRMHYNKPHPHHHHHHHSSSSLKRQQSDMTDSATSSSQHTLPQSIVNSQESNYSSSSDHAVTSPASDHSSAADNAIALRLPPSSSSLKQDDPRDNSDKIDQLLHLSTIAAAQDRISLDAAARTERKPSPLGGLGGPRDAPSAAARSLARGHARNASAVSIASTSGSTIGELSVELKTRLSYAMVKVNLGLQTHSIEEVECLASQATSASPAPGARAGATSASTLRGRQTSSMSPDIKFDATSAHGQFLQDAIIPRRKSASPMGNTSARNSTLAPPASIQATLSTPAAGLHPRRTSTPRHPSLLHSHSSAPQTPGYSLASDSHQSSSQPARTSDPPYFASQTRNAREQDAVETLLFMSSPNNSANMKHVFTPLASSDPSQPAAKSSGSATRPGPSGTGRKSLPSHRPASAVHKKTSAMLHPSDSPMTLDSPQHSYYSPNRVTPRRRNRGNSTHLRSALTLPVALGGGHSSARRVLRDEDIERMLDRVAAETADSSDDEDIQIPRLKNGVTGVMGIRG